MPNVSLRIVRLFERRLQQAIDRREVAKRAGTKNLAHDTWVAYRRLALEDARRLSGR